MRGLAGEVRWRMSTSDKRKQSLYFPDEVLKTIEAEAMRQDRSLSWIVQQACKTVRRDIKSMPSSDGSPTDDAMTKGTQ